MLKRPDLRAMLVESLREAFANGPQGWFDDAWALSTSWGFELREVAVPVQMWCGELDRNVPTRSVERMAAELDVQLLEITAVPLRGRGCVASLLCRRCRGGAGRRAQSSGLVGALPREVVVVATEMAVRGGLGVDRPQ
jgi:hypothetical protein